LPAHVISESPSSGHGLMFTISLLKLVSALMTIIIISLVL